MTFLDVVIDVSHFQKTIDWEQVAGDQIEVALVKVSQGATFTDPMGSENMIGASAAEIVPIPYHFFGPDAWQDQLEHFITCAGGVRDVMSLDWEGEPHSTLVAADVEAFGSALLAQGCKRLVGYWGRSGAAPGAPTPAMLSWDRWVPRYPFGQAKSFSQSSVTNPQTFCPVLPNLRMWQYSRFGQVSGISTNVDRSVALFPAVDALRDWAVGN